MTYFKVEKRRRREEEEEMHMEILFLDVINQYWL